MYRELPPKIKIYEALGSVADDRIEIVWLFGDEAKCYSSSLGKFYVVKYDSDQGAIMTNDNGSYRKWYLGYPAIAFLMKKRILSYDNKFADALKWIKRKDINQDFKNDFDKTAEYIHWILEQKGVNVQEFLKEVDNIFLQIQNLKLKLLWNKIKPPQWY